VLSEISDDWETERAYLTTEARCPSLKNVIYRKCDALWTRSTTRALTKYSTDHGVVLESSSGSTIHPSSDTC
jgi:hypothetical protein